MFQAHPPQRFRNPLITAIVYNEGKAIEPVMRSLVDHLAARGVAMVGFAQRDVTRPGRSRCDMILEELSSGASIGISEDWGAEAKGCRLDMGELMRALSVARARLDIGGDLLVVNKFGKAESNGGGFRPLIVEALERAMPVLVAVPVRNLDQWRAFADGLSTDHRFDGLPSDPAELCDMLGLNNVIAPATSAALHISSMDQTP